MNQQERDRESYRLAKNYLLEVGVEGVTPQLIEKQLCLSETKGRPQSIEDILMRLLESAQNANMRAGVIGGSIGGVVNLKPLLFDFSPTVIIEKYPTWEAVFEQIQMRLKPRGKMRMESRSIWPQYCRTILSASRFMAQFPKANDFYEWVDFFDQDERGRPALPLLIAQQVVGIGFPLACDFLKELGYVNFPKPDIHLRDIFEGLELCLPKSSDYELSKAIIRVAENANVTPYNADKLFWLIGSGYFYEDKTIGKDGRIGSLKKDFIEYARNRLCE